MYISYINQKLMENIEQRNKLNDPWMPTEEEIKKEKEIIVDGDSLPEVETKSEDE